MATANLYANLFDNAFKGNLYDFTSADNLKCMLLNSSHTFDEADNTVADINANEISDADYSRESLTAVSVSRSTGTITVDSDNISFGTSVTISASYAVIYNEGADDASSYLLEHIDFEGQQESQSGEFTLQVDSNGLFDVVT